MSVLLLDFETTALDTKEARIIEIGAQKVTDDFTQVKGALSTLVWESGYPALQPEIIKVTGINQAELTERGIRPVVALQMLATLVDADTRYVIAYNSIYDRGVFSAEVDRHTLTLDGRVGFMTQVPWLCAMTDIETNYQFKSWKLMHMALEYGVTVNPKLLHRAIADVDLMRQLLLASGVTIAAMAEFRESPWVYVAARVSFENKDLAKKQGFGWEQAHGDPGARRFEKTWVKRVKQKFYTALERECTFPLRVIGDA